MVLVQSQPPPPNSFTPRHSAGSAVVNGTLYVVSGSITVDIQPTADLFSLSLADSFSTDTAPWKALSPGLKSEDARVAPALSLNTLFMVGMGDAGSPLAALYDIKANAWHYVSSTSKPGGLQTPRTSAGIALDVSSGVMVVFGGYTQASVSSELDLMDSRLTDYDTLNWSVASTSSQLLASYQPIVVYLPNLNSTLIMGGSSTYSPSTGASGLQSFDVGYLVTTSVGPDGLMAQTKNVTMKGPIPTARLSPCHVVLSNGDVFMYGGTEFVGSLTDAWVLHTSDFSWSNVAIQNGPPLGRAGATCQMVTPNQIIIVGGYTGPLTGPKNFAQPQVGFIITDSWAWTQTYISSHNDKKSVIILVGVTIASCLFLGAILYTLIRIFRRKRKSSREKIESQQSQSSDRLLDNLNSGNDLSSMSARDKSKMLPLIITPYAPTESLSSGTMSATSTSPPPSSRASKQNKIDVVFPESQRLPKTVADIQYSHYAKTLQHGKQYDKRRSELLKQNPDLNKADTITQHQYLMDDDPTDQPYLVTTLLQLKDVEMGEEPVAIPMQTMGTGAMLISSHLEPPHLISTAFTGPMTPNPPSPSTLNPTNYSPSTYTPGTYNPRASSSSLTLTSSNGNQQEKPRNNVSVAPAMTSIIDEDENDEQYNYVPGVGGPITALKAAKAARLQAAEAESRNKSNGAGPKYEYVPAQGGGLATVIMTKRAPY
ncbi:hypothetical protein BGX26_012954 [Mortierella sp. AD094]|nr:hypothetical protein BGX26_012954 [Mortierella sp. AD094]